MSVNISIKNRFFHHLLFWITYIFLKAAVDLVFYPIYWSNVFLTTTSSLISLTFIYFNLSYLIPKFLLKKKYLIYFLAVCLLLVVNATIVWNFTVTFTTDYFDSFRGFIVIISDVLLLVSTTTVIKLLRAWYQKERYTRELEKKHLETELNYLKAQVNPHFLFNTLNNIYFSVDQRPAVAKEMLLQLSEMLSYQLYDVKNKQVSLEQELAYLKRYVHLEEIRQEDIVDVTLHFSALTEALVISPMLLLPFVENAFKHGDKTSPKGYWITIKATCEAHKLFFTVENTYEPKEHHHLVKSGIGLENVKRRLALLYPQKHQLTIETFTQTSTTSTQVHVFAVQLTIELAKKKIQKDEKNIALPYR
ncbi:MAG: histidine kinase [Bacteroidota bacterium]